MSQAAVLPAVFFFADRRVGRSGGFEMPTSAGMENGLLCRAACEERKKRKRGPELDGNGVSSGPADFPAFSGFGRRSGKKNRRREDPYHDCSIAPGLDQTMSTSRPTVRRAVPPTACLNWMCMSRVPSISRIDHRTRKKGGQIRRIFLHQ